MIWETLRALVFGGLPVTVFTFLIVQWSISSGRMGRFSGGASLQEQHRMGVREIRKSAKVKKAAKRGNPETIGKPHNGRPSSAGSRAADLFHNRLVSFGGGYYGTMAVLTYLLIECIEVWQFALSLFDPEVWINRLGLDLLIDFLVNTITNLIAAFIWFATLPDYFTVNNGWLWLLATYGAYHLGLQISALAGDSIWAGLGSPQAARSAKEKSRGSNQNAGHNP